ncbi:peptidase MA family metallohydrolase [Planctomycetota bacterium]
MSRILLLVVTIILCFNPCALAWETRQYNDRLLLRYPDKQLNKALGLAKIFEERRQFLTEYFNKDFPWPTELVLCATESQFKTEVTGLGHLPVAAIAQPDKGKIVINLPRSEGLYISEISNVIAHEICHLIYWEFGLEAAAAQPGRLSPRAPLWFNEGIACWLAGVDIYINDEILLEARSRQALLTLDELWDSFPRDTWKFKLAYAQSKDFVRYIHMQTRHKTIPHILQEYARSGDFEEAVRKVTGTRLADLYFGWKVSLPRTYLPVTKWFQNSYLLMFASVLVLLAVLKIRRRNRHIREKWQFEDSFSVGD